MEIQPVIVLISFIAHCLSEFGLYLCQWSKELIVVSKRDSDIFIKILMEIVLEKVCGNFVQK